MREGSNIMDLIQLKPDYIGFIFYEKSPRYVQQVPKMEMDASVQKVGVFVDAGEQTIQEKRIQFGLDILQLHGNESPEFCFLLKQSGARVMKVFNVDESFDFQQTRRYEDYCDYFLFDTQTKAYGGSGRKFNWQLLEKYNNARPVFLSGGIGPNDANSIKVMKNINLKAIDINSQFEIEPALKDIELLSKFFTEIRNQ